MSFLKEYRRRSIIPLLTLGLAAYYLFVFLPLGKRSQELDRPLERSWKHLATSLGQSNAVSVDFAHITNQLDVTRETLVLLDSARKKTAARLELGAAVREKLAAPFQLVEYQYERSKEIDALGAMAKKQGVKLAPNVLAALPEHRAEIPQPELLWAALSVADGLLTTALQCKVAAIDNLVPPLLLTNVPPEPGLPSLTDLPFHLELTGASENVAKFLHYLPLRGAEARATGLPDAPEAKPPVFIDRLLIKKQTPEKPDEVQLSLDVKGFVLRE